MLNETCLYLPSTLSDVLITTSLRLTGNFIDARTFLPGNFGSRSFKKQEKSAVALHMLTKDGANRNYLHNFDHTSLELVKRVTNASKLDALESIVN
jgi:hypothetical protein